MLQGLEGKQSVGGERLNQRPPPVAFNGLFLRLDTIGAIPPESILFSKIAKRAITRLCELVIGPCDITDTHALSPLVKYLNTDWKHPRCFNSIVNEKRVGKE